MRRKDKYSINYLGEHHMGAVGIEIVLEKSFKGVSKFRCTNGGVLDEPSGRFLVLFDAGVILVLDYMENSVYHLIININDGYKTPHIEGGKTLYLKSSYSGNKHGQSFNLETKSGLTKGFGPVRQGRFPSAYP